MVMRITSSSSGLDIDKLVSDLMKAERIPQNKLKQKKLQLDYQTEMYREVNTKLSTLRDTLNDMKYSSLMTGLKATSSSGAVTATVNGTAALGNSTIKVEQLASSAKLTSSTLSTTPVQGTDIDFSQPLEIKKDVNDKFILTVNGTARVVTLAEGSYSTIGDLQTQVDKAIKSQFGTVAQVKVETSGNALTLTPTTVGGVTGQIIVNDYSGQTNPLGFTNGQSYYMNLNMKLSDLQSQLPGLSLPTSGTKATVMINGATIEYDENTTLKQFMADVNSSSAGVKMSFDQVSNTFSLVSSLTGSSSKVDIESDDGNLLQSLGFALTSGAEATGTDAIYYLNGSTTAQTSSTNNFSRDGIGYKLNQVGESTITVGQDTDTIVNKIKKFVDAYNDLIDLVNTRLGEKRDPTILPLTDDDKAGLSDSDITLWEQKAKSGLLRNSSILQNVKTELRSVFSKVFDGLPAGSNTLSSIGLSTAAFQGTASSVSGKITLDEDKLRNAIDADPSSVSKMFTTNNGIDSYEGAAVSLYKRVDDLMSRIVSTAGRGTGSTFDSASTLGKQVVNLNTKILTMDDVLAKKEDLYYQRFTAMDKAIANSNAQINWLSQQIGS